MGIQEKIARRAGWAYEKATLPRADFVSVEKRSDSDNGRYPEFCLQAALNPRVFNRFRQGRIYRGILEHVTQDEGEQYAKTIARHLGGLTPPVSEAVLLLNSPGSPALSTIYDVGRCSPTALRYAKVAMEIIHELGISPGSCIAEIGAGYGGQALVADRLLSPASYDMFDLWQVNMLIQRFLESHFVGMTYGTHVISQFPGGRDYDLVISNYAFSELPRPLQETYMEKVILRARHGYMTMNSDPRGREDRLGSYSQAELLAAIPGARIKGEFPLTGPHNYILLW